MTDLINKVKALEASHRKTPETPRAWADSIIRGLYALEQVPEHFREFVSDHLETHRMMVNAKAMSIIALPNGKARLGAFNELDKEMQPLVKDRIHAIKNQKGEA